MDKWYSFYIMMAPLAVDTFLFVTGVLIAYTFLRTMSKPNAKFNVFLYYLHRYLRIMPALAAMYFVTVTVVRYIGSGPAWNSYMGNMRDNCLNNWWSFFFYFHNYMREGICLGHTWYLAVDMQLFILSPILLIPLLKYPKHAMCYEIPIVIAISIAIPVAVFYVYDIQVFTAGYNDFYYYATHTRFAPWVIGIAFGAFFARNLPGQTKFNLSWSLNLSIWVAALAVAAAIFFSERDTRGNGHAEKLRHILHRPVWAVCLGWFSFACTYGYGTFVNWFLSLGVFQVLSKLSYSIYIVHITIIFIHLGRQRTTNYFDDYFAMYNVFGDTILTIGVAVFWTLAFESPMITIEKVLFAKGTPNNTKGTQNKTVPEIKVS